jgi:hypothetical protein
MAGISLESGYLFFVFELGERCDIRYAQIEKGSSFGKLLKTMVNSRYNAVTVESNIALVLHHMFMVPSTLIEPHDLVKATADLVGGRMYKKRCSVYADPEYVSAVLGNYCRYYHQFIAKSLRVPKRGLPDSPIVIGEQDEYDTTDGFVVDDEEPLEYVPEPSKKIRLIKLSDRK